MFFANGKTFYSCGCTPEEATLRALHTFYLAKEWFTDNWLKLNGSKTQVDNMGFG